MRTFLRCVDEVLVIGDDTQVTVLEIQTDFVRLAISTTGLNPSYRVEVLYVKTSEELVETYGLSEDQLEFSEQDDDEFIASVDSLDGFDTEALSNEDDFESDADSTDDSPYDTGSGRYSIAPVRLF